MNTLSVTELRTKSLQHFVNEEDCEAILSRKLDVIHNMPCLLTRAVVRRTNFFIAIENDLNVSIEIVEFNDTETFIVKGQHDWLIALEHLKKISPDVELGKQYDGCHTYNLSLPN